MYKKKIKASTNFFHYTVYALLFPHLIAGPIVRYSEIFQEIKKRYVDYQSFFRGLVFFSVGLFLKTFIADQLFPLEEHLDTLITQLDTLKAVIITLSFSLRLYFDFLGYSLMAIGIASFFGFHFPDNFDSPYTSVSITDFWQKWNISLSLWIRDYIYIPLGGNRKGEIRTNLNLLITMILAGLWHGAGWNYIVWGTLHGCFLVTERILPQNIIAKLPKRIRQILTFILVSSLWVIFKFKTLSEAKLVFHAMTTWTFFPLEDITQNILFATIPAWLIGVFWIICIKEKNLKAIQPNVWKLIFFSCLLFFSISFSMVKRSIAFIYFQF
ncbi:MAG: MBOAT family O-acyltransferase [Patescibacteria group bacterium]